jgi:hypothetical protein
MAHDQKLPDRQAPISAIREIVGHTRKLTLKQRQTRTLIHSLAF